MLLRDYWPRFLSELFEFQEIAGAEQPEFSIVVHDIEEAADDFFLVSLSDYGCSRWEKIMELVPAEGTTIADRRRQILLKYLSRLPYTETMLRNYLERILGEGEVVVEIDYDEYALSIEYGGGNDALLASLYTELRQMIPANMGFTLSAMEELAMALYAGTVLQVTDSLEVI